MIVCVGVVAGAFYLHRLRQPLPSTNPGPPPDLLSELQPDAPAIAYIDVAELRKSQNSPLSTLLGLTGFSSTAESGSKASRPARNAPSQNAPDREYADFVRDTGFDYTRDLDQAAIAVWPSNLTAAGNAAGDNPAFAVADGRFDQKKIEAYALRVGGRTKTAGTHTRYIVPGYPMVAFEFLSPTRIAIASGKKPEDLLNLPAKSTRDPALQARINRIGGAPVFGLARMDRLPNSFYANFENSPQLEHVIRSIRGVSFAAQPEGDQVRFALDAECDSMTSAIEISTLLDSFRLVGSMALSDPKTRAQFQMTPQQFALLQAFIKQAEVTHQDHWLRIALDATPAMLGEPSPAPHSSRAGGNTR